MTQEVSTDEAVRIALDWQKQGRLAEARSLYERILHAEPDHAQALHFSGLLHYQLGAHGEGIARLRRAVAIDPDQPTFWNNLGNMFLEQGDLSEAERAYRKAQALAPDWVDPKNNLGLLLQRLGRSEAAEALYRRAIASDPEHPVAFNNLGQLLGQTGRLEEAIPLLEQAIARKPDFAEAWKNLGQTLEARGRTAEAVRAYRRAVECGADAYLALATSLRDQGLIEEAIRAYRKVLTLGGRQATAFHSLGMLLNAQGRREEAAQVFQAWLDWDPDHPVATHLLAASQGDRIPSRASDAYVEAIFDGFASAFDRRLQTLEYRAPQRIAEALQRWRGPPRGDLRILDAGCGTGLCAPLLRPFARTLIGVDLSARMLEKARTRGGYDELVKGELTAFLQGSPRAFDLIISGDTLVYFGDLVPVLTAARRALTPGGALLATLEREADAARAEPHLQGHGRYSHSEPYVRTACREAGLTLDHLEPTILRQEMGKPVSGWLFYAQPPS